MKKAILLTAIAGTFALSSFAGENPTVAPAKFKGETPNAAWKTYILLEQTSEKTTFFGGNGIATPYAADAELVGWNLTNAGSPTYLRDENGTKYGWKYVINKQNVQSSPDNYYQFTSDADAEPFELRRPEHNRENGAYQLVASYNGTYDGYKYYETKLGYLSHSGFMSRTVTDQSGKADLFFISQSQMDFHNKAQEIANLFTGSDKYAVNPGLGYIGKARENLIAAIQTEGTSWRAQLVALEAANEAYLDAYDACTSTANDTTVYMGGANAYTYTFKLQGNEGDHFTVSVEKLPIEGTNDYYEPNFTVSPMVGDLDESGEATITVTLTRQDKVWGSDINKLIAGATISAYVGNIAVPGATVYGAYPALSFDPEWEYDMAADAALPTTTKVVNIPAATTEPIEIPFYAYGFFNEHNDLANINVTLVENTKKGNTDALTVIAGPKKFSENNLDEEGKTLCGIQVSFNPTELGIVSGTYMISCGIDGVEPLYLNVNACESAIDVLDEEVRFGADAAEKVITIAYSNFQGVNDGKYLTILSKSMMAADPSISVQFIDANGDTSNELHGTGTIQAIVKYDPSLLDEQIGNPEYTYVFVAIDEQNPDFVKYNADAWDEIIISRCNPFLKVVADPRHDGIYTMKEDLEEHTFEIEFAYISAPYDLSDMIVRTETDIFIVKDVIYSGDAENGKLHINVQYNPHVKNTKYTDRLTVSCGSVEAGWDLIGDPVKAVSYGTNGIEEIETEVANGAAYNVAGQKVKANAKGIVIMNGVKNFNK